MILAIVFNILSTYLWPVFDRYLPFWPRKSREVLDKAKGVSLFTDNLRADINETSRDPSSEVRLRLNAIYFTLLGIIWLLLFLDRARSLLPLSVPCAVLTIVFVSMGWSAHVFANNMGEAVHVFGVGHMRRSRKNKLKQPD
jgi:hypothetical protein